MSEAEVRAEAVRFGVPQQDDLVALRKTLSAELGRRWAEENQGAIEAFTEWYEREGDPLAGLRVQ